MAWVGAIWLRVERTRVGYEIRRGNGEIEESVGGIVVLERRVGRLQPHPEWTFLMVGDTSTGVDRFQESGSNVVL